MNILSNKFFATVFFVLTLTSPAIAYIGPGAGFAFFTSFSTFFIIILLAIMLIVTWPIRHLYLRLRYGHRKNKRVVILGLDGLDPELVSRFMKEGHLENFRKLKDEGSFSTLATTCPALSPVAWSTFVTGVNPGRHNIFDFLTSDRNTYMALLSSTRIEECDKQFSIGKYSVPLGTSKIQGLRKGKPFWEILGEKGYSSSILRVPITFPPEKFRGRILSAMCIPDIHGTQGTFTFYTTDQQKVDRTEGGKIIPVTIQEGKINAEIPGPSNFFLKDRPEVSIPFVIEIQNKNSKEPYKQKAILKIRDKVVELSLGRHSEWIDLEFPMVLGMKIHGICRFLLTSLSPHFGLYITPVQISPANPSLPISYPSIYSTYLSLAQGTFATLGLAEDTWGLNEEILSEDNFIEQAYMIHEEREKMFFHEVDKVKRGVCACVFDITDRIQHMFFKYQNPARNSGKNKDTILELYKNMDKMLGRLLEKINDNDLLMVISDHGFKAFERGVNLNSWLMANGYLFLKKGEEQNKDKNKDTSQEWFRNVDWSKTKAYALGLGGIFLNKKGRDRQGIVSQKESLELCREIQEKLTGLTDPEKKETAILNVHMAKDIYNGPYIENSPELIVGFNKGYRVSWKSAKGVADDVIFSDNTKNWSGDHCVDPSIVPGVFFSNRRLKTTSPRIMDIGATVLKEFGVKIPSFMEGKPLDLMAEKK